MKCKFCGFEAIQRGEFCTRECYVSWVEERNAQLERVAEAAKALIDTGCPVHAEFGLCPLCGQHYSKEHRDDCEWGMAEKALAELESK